MKISGQKVLITGGGSGIGRELIKALLADGAIIATCGRSSDKLDRLESEHPEVHVFPCDVTDMKDILKLKTWVSETLGGVNILINNAGRQSRFNFLDESQPVDDLWPDIVTNLMAPMMLTKIMLPLLMKEETGAVVNISSSLGLTPKANAPLYGASKAGLHSFTRALRLQLAETSVQAIEVLPAQINTDTSWGPEPGQVFAARVLDGLKRDRQQIMPGKSWGLAMLERLSPTAAERKIAAMVKARPKGKEAPGERPPEPEAAE